jgi:hypothetical protein
MKFRVADYFPMRKYAGKRCRVIFVPFVLFVERVCLSLMNQSFLRSIMRSINPSFEMN